MKGIVKTLIVVPIAGFVLGGCTEWTVYFYDGDPADVSSCAYVMNDPDLLAGIPIPDGPDTLAEMEGSLCVECNSDGPSTDKASYCGTELKVRCNSDLGYPIYGIAIGGGGDGQLFAATAWEDEDDDGDDLVVCHSQSIDSFGKEEWKCTNALKGNGKDATTFEVEIKYDESKNDCV